MHMRPDLRPPVDMTHLSSKAGYTTAGWAAPGHFPEPDSRSKWLNREPRGSYPPSLASRTCSGNATSQTCYVPVLGSLWWGDAIRLTATIHTRDEQHHISLTSPRITLVHQRLGSGLPFSYPRPPPPWKPTTRLASQLRILGILPAGVCGYFWYRPLYWAVYYTGQTTTLHPDRTVATRFNATDLFPVSRSARLEGIYGFQPSCGIGPAPLLPAKLAFYPLRYH